MAQEILKPFILDETGKDIVIALNSIVEQLAVINETLKSQQTGGETS